jgi:hypothetical protein
LLMAPSKTVHIGQLIYSYFCQGKKRWLASSHDITTDTPRSVLMTWVPVRRPVLVSKVASSKLLSPMSLAGKQGLITKQTPKKLSVHQH